MPSESDSECVCDDRKVSIRSQDLLVAKICHKNNAKQGQHEAAHQRGREAMGLLDAMARDDAAVPRLNSRGRLVLPPLALHHLLVRHVRT
jgi:hypothetical protein